MPRGSNRPNRVATAPSHLARRPSGPHRGAALALALAIPAVAWLAPGCGTDAVGIDACRQIESARCDVAPRCVGFADAPPIETEQQVQNCREFYRDHCLLGLENIDAEAGQGEIDSCVKAIRDTADCKDPKKSTMAACGVELRDGLDNGVAPCEVLQKPHWLQSCRWLDKNKKIGSGSGGDGGAGGAGGAGGVDPTTAETSSLSSTVADAASTVTSRVAAVSGGFDEGL